MPGAAFGACLKKHRLAKKLTLRAFCAANGLDPGNYSRLERGLFPAPREPQLLEKYAVALGIERGSGEWLDFFDVAAASRGEIPQDLLDNEALMEKLPLLFRTLRATPVEGQKLDKLVEELRKG